tara:strand:- start:51 stop:491 length:441 start_codon:yes stop_codon:yes gene_type:complete
MQPDADSNNRTHQFWGSDEKPASQQQFSSLQQQIIITNPKYKPALNLRIISTGIIVLGSLIAIALPFIGIEASELLLFEISSYVCCSSFIISLLVDAVYLKGKSDWETSIGLGNTWSLVSLVLSIMVAIGLIIILIITILTRIEYS